MSPSGRDPGSDVEAGPLLVAITRLDPDLALPAYARMGDAGLDLVARTTVVISAGGGRCLVPTGVAVAIPPGHAGLIVPRSGLAARHGLSIVNSPGLVDSGYRGELIVALLNTDPNKDIRIERGDRIAQLVILAVPAVCLIEVASLPESPGGEGSRGTGGYGHTGR